MPDKRKMKDIDSCSIDLPLNEPLYPLQKWYVRLMDKTYEDLEISDVTRMLRQNVLIETAVHKAIDLLKDNPFCGDLYEGEILDKLSALELMHLSFDKQALNEILDRALEENERYDWLAEEERMEYKKMVCYFRHKLKEQD